MRNLEDAINGMTDRTTVVMPSKKWRYKVFNGKRPLEELIDFLNEGWGEYEFKILRTNEKEIVIIYLGY